MATTSSIPGAENVRSEKQTSIARAYDYPVVKDTLSFFNSQLESHQLTAGLYHRVAALTASILEQLKPLPKRFGFEKPISLADAYANAALDFLEQKAPFVKNDTKELVDRARQPADQAYEVAQGYKNGIQQRISPVTDQLFSRLDQGQQTLAGLQDRLAQAVKAGKENIPHDQASLKQTLELVQSELDNIVKAAAALPANAQAHAGPVIEGLKEAATDVRKELTRQDIPLGAKAANILSYTQDRLTPIFEQGREYLNSKKDEAEAKTNEAQEKATK